MRYAQPIHLVFARRSPIGRFGGALKSIPPADLLLPVAAAVVPASLRAAIDQVILGQVLQAGAGLNVARQLGLRLGLPQSSPAFTVNMACASGLKSIMLAAEAIALGEASLVLAGGVESMSRAPHLAPDLRWGRKFGDAPLLDSIRADGLSDPVLGLGMGETAERIADQLGIDREAQDRFALASQQRAAAHRAGFERELVSMSLPAGELDHDEQPRPDITLEKLSRLPPAFRTPGTVTAGNSSGLNDGAALALLAGAEAIARHSLEPRARLVAATAVGCDPATMGLGPVAAIRRLVQETSWNLADVEAVEINEAFAAQTLGCIQELKLDPSRVNQRGGAIALGHPIGCSGARVLVTLLHLLEDRSYRRGIASLCVGGGMGVALALERG